MLSNFRIGTRLAMAIAVPLAILVILSGYNLSLKWSSRDEMVRLGALSDGVAGISRLIHHL